MTIIKVFWKPLAWALKHQMDKLWTCRISTSQYYRD